MDSRGQIGRHAQFGECRALLGKRREKKIRKGMMNDVVDLVACRSVTRCAPLDFPRADNKFFFFSIADHFLLPSTS